MSFLKRLFGGQSKEKEYVDKRGIYFYVRCDNCGTCVRVRADKEYDLLREGGGFVWHKTIVDNRCFRPMSTVVYLDGNYQVTSEEISGGHYISQAEYEASLRLPDVSEPTDGEETSG